ncbi:hypothetical protein Q5752_001911 [Cryptotrichosporon argae]
MSSTTGRGSRCIQSGPECVAEGPTLISPGDSRHHNGFSASCLLLLPTHLAPAGRPVDNYTFPFCPTEPSPLADARTTSELPNDADLIIVGSGLSAAFIAYNVIKAKPETRLVLVTRELCRGASARNDPGRKVKYGAEAANKLREVELSTSRARRG